MREKVGPDARDQVKISARDLARQFKVEGRWTADGVRVVGVVAGSWCGSTSLSRVDDGDADEDVSTVASMLDFRPPVAVILAQRGLDYPLEEGD